MAGSGDSAGYFFALVLLICAPPCILLIIGKWRRMTYKEDCFEAKLAASARKYIEINRDHAMSKHFYETSFVICF